MIQERLTSEKVLRVELSGPRRSRGGSHKGHISASGALLVLIGLELDNGRPQRMLILSASRALARVMLSSTSMWDPYLSSEFPM